MMLFRSIASAIAGAAMLSTAACQTEVHMTPATLGNADAGNVEALKSALAEATGRAHVDILETDLASASHVSVLPPPPGEFETHSLAMPVEFDIFVDEGVCTLVRRDTGESFPAPDVSCAPVAD